MTMTNIIFLFKGYSDLGMPHAEAVLVREFQYRLSMKKNRPARVTVIWGCHILSKNAC
jgi:hypothetical protein